MFDRLLLLIAGAAASYCAWQQWSSMPKVAVGLILCGFFSGIFFA
jgi:hypothetical protein